MRSSIHRLVLVMLAIGCIVPVFALTSVTLTNGTVSRGTMVSEGPEFIVLNVDGVDVTIPRATISSMANDESQAVSAPAQSGEVAESPAETSPEAAQPIAEPVVSDNAELAPHGSRLGRITRERVSIGVDVYLNTFYQSITQNQYNTNGSRTTSNLTLKPYIGIRRSDIFELRPALNFSRWSVSTDSTVEEGLDYSPPGSMQESFDTDSTRLGVDMGFMFYPIRGDFFRFSIGPSIGFNWGFAPTIKRTYVNEVNNTELEYDAYFDMSIPIRIPVGFDFVVSEHLGFRLSGEVYGVNINIRHVDGAEPSTVDYTAVTASTTLDLSKTVLEFGIGAFFLF